MAYPNYRSQFGDTTYTKVFVGGLAWETPTDKMRRYFEQFGEILEAVVITDKVTGRSKGYGFVTFRDPDSARKACEEPNPVIDGRKANCNVAALGRPRPSPPRVLNAGGRTQGVNPYHGAGPQGAPLFNQVGAPLSPQPPMPMPPPAPSVIYPPYGYTTYTPDYGYHHTLYNPHIQAQYYQHQQMYGASSSTVGSPYYYGYNSLQASPSPRGGPAYTATQAQFSRAPFYMHYPAQGEGPFTMLSQPTGPAPTRQQPVPPSSSSSDSQIPAQESSSTTGGMGVSNISESQ